MRQPPPVLVVGFVSEQPARKLHSGVRYVNSVSSVLGSGHRHLRPSCSPVNIVLPRSRYDSRSHPFSFPGVADARSCVFRSTSPLRSHFLPPLNALRSPFSSPPAQPLVPVNRS